MIYWIKKGRVKLSYLDESGRKLALDIFGKGQLFGELSLTQVDKRELLAEALEPTEVIAADRNRLLENAKRDARLMFEILTLIGSRSRSVQHKLEDMAFKDLPTRLARVLLHLAETHGHPSTQGLQIDCRLTHQDLADLIGATRTNVTMMLSMFYSKGLLKKGRYITIANEQQLREKGYGAREKQLN
jgi:CRP/FNR family transcriptional regulator